MKTLSFLSRGLIATFLLFVLSFPISAQRIKTAKEIIEIIEKSDMQYALKILENEISVPDRSNIVVHHNHEFTKEQQGVLSEAETLFDQSNTMAARVLYESIFSKDTTAYLILDYIGDTYFDEQNYEEAKKYYQMAISKNYFDYLAHWSLADVLCHLDDKKTALREISIAKILNRNNRLLHSKFLEIYSLNKVNYNDWTFNPQYRLSFKHSQEENIDVVTVEFDKCWLGYALNKAVWEYESGYAENAARDEFEKIWVQERECVSNLLISNYESEEMESNIELKALSLAFENDCFDSYVMYEAVLPDYPLIASHLDEKAINAMADYLINVRSKIK